MTYPRTNSYQYNTINTIRGLLLLVFKEYTFQSCIYYRFIVRFPIGLDYPFITFIFLFHLLLSWTSSLSISSSAISASTCLSWSSNRSSAFNSILHTILHPVLITFSHHMSIPSQSTTSNESCDRLNSNQPS